jgi:hypothetical protein
MIWFFERDRSRLHYEIRRQTDGQDYELVITYPGGEEVVEHYPDAASILERSTRLQNGLIADGWHQPTSRRRTPRRRADPEAADTHRAEHSGYRSTS